MAFPPTFTNVWDLTQPPDTQLLNQGALDFRNLKNDTMQRLSLLSGTLANRPTPETVNATWGGAGFGLVYLSTDTNQLFQWSGAAWVDISSSFALTLKLSDLVTHTLVNPAVNTDGSIIQIPAGALSVKSIVSGEARVTLTGFAAGGGPTVAFTIGSVGVVGSAPANNGTLYFAYSFAIVSGSVEAGVVTSQTSGSANNFVATAYNGADNSALQLTIKTSIQVSGAAIGTYVFDYLTAIVNR